MTLVNREVVTKITFTKAGGDEETWEFPEGAQAYYLHYTNNSSSGNPVQETWHEHDLRWISDRQREVKGGKGTKRPEEHLQEAPSPGAPGESTSVHLPQVQADQQT